MRESDAVDEGGGNGNGINGGWGAKVRLEIKTFDGSICVRTSAVWAESQIKHEPQRHSTIEGADYKKKKSGALCRRCRLHPQDGKKVNKKSRIKMVPVVRA